MAETTEGTLAMPDLLKIERHATSHLVGACLCPCFEAVAKLGAEVIALRAALAALDREGA